jgi:hypothetical protein
VFDMIAANAVRLCDGYFSAVYVSDGERVHIRATHNLLCSSAMPRWATSAFRARETSD